jgi:hypothetical protein
MAKERPATTPAETPSTPREPGCIHHWVLSEPHNGIIDGRCKRCGTERSYSANPEGTERFDDFRELTQSSTYYKRENASA